jgi:hypothetical protein
MDTSKNTFMTTHFEELDLIPKFMEGLQVFTVHTNQHANKQ